MFINAFMATKIADGVTYDGIGSLTWNAHCVLGLPVRAIAEWLLKPENRDIVLALIPSYAN